MVPHLIAPAASPPAGSADPAEDVLSVEQAIAETAERCSNGGRWGPGDALGTRNVIDADKRGQAAALVRQGVAISLTQSFDLDGPRLHRTEVAAVTSDTRGSEVSSDEFPVAVQPPHPAVIPHPGLLVGERWDLEALAEACAAAGSHDLLTAAPLTATGACGAPLNPVALR